jgi:hypothetical protein
VSEIQPRKDDAAKLGRMSYDDILEELAIYGSPASVTARLLELRETRLLDSGCLDERRGPDPARTRTRFHAALRRARDSAPRLNRYASCENGVTISLANGSS